MRSKIKKIILAGMGILFFVSMGYTQFSPRRERIVERIRQRRLKRQSPYGSGDFRRFINFEGKERFYDIHVPKGYSKDRPMPLVLNLHGGSGNPVQQRQDTEMDRTSDANGFIVIYPGGTGPVGKYKFLFWNAGMGNNSAVRNKVNDVGFVKALLEDISEIFNIDPKKVYCTGISNGGAMCYRLACEMTECFAAIAPVATVTDFAVYNREPTRPTSIIHFHGRQDEVVPYKGGTSPVKTLANTNLPSVEETIKFWVNFNGCPFLAPTTFKKGQATCAKYGPCKENTEVILWTLEDAGHTWPGGHIRLPETKVGKTNTDISANDLIWEFFRKHPRP